MYGDPQVEFVPALAIRSVIFILLDRVGPVSAHSVRVHRPLCLLCRVVEINRVTSCDP